MVMIQCVGSRNEENPNCSRICCQTAVKNALHLKELNPDMNVYVLYRDIRTYGLLEDYYTEARKKGVFFFRFDAEDPPVVESSEDGVEVTFTDHVLNRTLKVAADLLVLSAGMQAEDTEELSSILKLARTPEGYFMEAHVKLQAGGYGHRGNFCLRYGPQSQTGFRNHCPGLCRIGPGHHLPGPTTVDTVRGDRPGRG